MTRKWLKPLAIVLWIGIWFAAAAIINDSLKFPGPIETATVLFGRVIPGKGFLGTVGTSMFRILAGFLASCILGLALGTLAGLWKWFADIMEPIITVIKSTPVMSFIILAMIWFRFSTVPVIICFLMCFPIMYGNIKEGIAGTDTRLLDMAKLYRVRRGRILTGIYMQSVRPYFYSAANICLGLGFKVTVAAEVLTSPDFGIGTKLFEAKIYLEPVEVFAWTFIILVLSYVMEQLLKLLFSERGKGVPVNAPEN